MSDDDNYTRDPAEEARQAARMLMMFNQAAEGSVYVLRHKGADSMCGCPILCKGPSLKCNFNPNFLPDELNGIISMADFSSMVADLDQALKDTHLPTMPCIFTHFCLPFSPVCAMFYCQSQRIKRIEAVLREHSHGLIERGYYWEMVPTALMVHGLAFLKMNKTAAERYRNSKNGFGGDGVVTATAVVTYSDSYPSAPVGLATAEIVPTVPHMKREY